MKGDSHTTAAVDGHPTRSQENASGGSLMVPVKVDALVLEHDQVVVGAAADFTRLPYNDGTRDVNSDIANLSENIVLPPFENQTLNLRAGIHLHWALPAALTRGLHTAGAQQGADKTDFPAVPNRWLVVRRSTNAAAEDAEQSWVVESDYLYPEGTTDSRLGTSVPVPPHAEKGHRQPFRIQGRTVPLSLWQPADARAEYLDKLTAIGPGEPTYAAFYPNCHGVFGLHDGDHGDYNGLQYDVVGWYSDPSQDPLASFLAGFVAEATSKVRLAEQQASAVKETFGWQLDLGADQDFPQRMVCYGRLTFQTSGSPQENPALSKNTAVTVAHTGTEALSTYLAHRIDETQAGTLEDQLEALQLAGNLASRKLDLGAKFREARHEKGFVGVEGGTLWRVVRRNDPAAPTGDGENATPDEITLPDALAHQLNLLNTQQQAYDLATQEILSRRRQLFADWYKYMMCAYPPEDHRDQYPSPDEARYFIEQQDLQPLQELVVEAGTLSVSFDDEGGVESANDASSGPGSLAQGLADTILGLVTALKDFNKSAPVKQARAVYSLRPSPGPRYWLPREPVVLLVGEAVEPGGRHETYNGANSLVCHLCPDVTSVADRLPDGVHLLTACITSIGTSSGIVTWTWQPWNPLLLEWEVEFLPLALGSNLNTSDNGYSPDFITSSYALDVNEPDLALRPGMGALQHRSCVYSGSSILTTQAKQIISTLLAPYADQSKRGADSVQQSGMSPDHASYANFGEAAGLLEDPEHPFHCLSQALGGFNES
ncbi:MAG TPA: hypothetical protein VEX13_17545, partial [Chloroflexia bacterium]|nr:hypothetical protein [Chloroflexia bacterium]